MSLKIRLVLKVRIAAAIAVVLLAMSVEARALPLWSAVPRAVQGGAMSRAAANFWAWLTAELLPGSSASPPRSVSLAVDAGCGMDPNGCPTVGSSEHHHRPADARGPSLRQR